MATEFKKVNKLYATLDEAYFYKKGWYQGLIEVRIEGHVRDYGYRKETNLWVRVYWQGHLMNYYCNPFKTMATARKYAKKMFESEISWAKTAREKNFPKRSNYDSHVPTYRNWNADRGLPYFNAKRKFGPLVLENERYDVKKRDYFDAATRRPCRPVLNGYQWDEATGSWYKDCLPPQTHALVA